MGSWNFKRLIAASVVMLFVWSLSGILLLRLNMEPAPEANSAPASSIRVLIRTGTESSALRKLVEPIRQETGIGVEMIELGREGYFTYVGTQLLSGSDTFDIVFLPNTWIAQFAANKAIVPLDEYIAEAMRRDPVSFDLDDFLAISVYNGEIFALPTDISTHFLYYRSDLIPEPPETWDDVYEIAERHSAFVRTDSPTKWGLAMPGVVPEERTKIFASLLWSFGGDFLDEGGGTVLLDSDASIRSGEYLARLVRERLVPGDLLSWDFIRTRDALLAGEIAMAAPYWNAAYTAIRQSDSPYRDVIKIALLPGVRQSDGTVRRVPFQHSWTMAINASSRNKEAAWTFLEFITGKRGGMMYAEAGGVPARRSLLGHPDLQSKRPEFPLVLESMEMAESEPSVPYYPAMVSIVEQALAKTVTLYDDPRQAFLAAATELRRISMRAGKQTGG
jgi:ABC-type sugar transport system, periplasmic component